MVPDTLSRRQELRIIFTGESSLMRKIREDYQDDEESKKILDMLRLGKKLEHFRLERGVDWFKQKRMLVPKGKFKVGTFEGVPRWSGGGASWRETNFGRVGEELLLAKLAGRRGAICKSRVTCQQNRIKFRKEAGLLRPLPIPTKCWEKRFDGLHNPSPKVQGVRLHHGGR